MNTKYFAKICAIALTGTMFLTSTGFAVSAKSSTNSAKTTTASSAASATSKTKDASGLHFQGKGFSKKDMSARMASDLKAAVEAKIITQAESDKIQAYMTGSKPEKGKDLFSSLVTKGILTQTKADALKAYLKSQRELKRQEELKTEISKFVTDKTITQAQADKIIAAINSADAARKAAFEKAKTMSKNDAKTFLDNFRKTQTDPLKALVTDGTITQAQADKIGAALHQGRGPEGGKMPKGKQCPNGRGCGAARED